MICYPMIKRSMVPRVYRLFQWHIDPMVSIGSVHTAPGFVYVYRFVVWGQAEHGTKKTYRQIKDTVHRNTWLINMQGIVGKDGAREGDTKMGPPGAQPNKGGTNLFELNNAATVEEWLLLRVGSLPRNSLGWFRCGVGFYNKKEYAKAIECFDKSVELDPLNVCATV